MGFMGLPDEPECPAGEVLDRIGDLSRGASRNSETLLFVKTIWEADNAISNGATTIEEVMIELEGSEVLPDVHESSDLPSVDIIRAAGQCSLRKARGECVVRNTIEANLAARNN